MKKRVIAMLLALSLLLTGCGASAKDENRDDIVVSIWSEPSALCGGFAASVVVSLISGQMFDTLIAKSPDYSTYVPCLATEWEFQNNNEALKKISVLIAAYLRSVDTWKWDNKYNFLITGDSGSGKTTTIRAIQKLLDALPSIVVDASMVTQVGFKGVSANQIFTNKIIKARCGVVFLDEIDKMMKSCFDSSGTNISVAVQDSFLKMLDGDGVYTDDGQLVETNRILFIGCGAFADVVGVKPKSVNAIGFASMKADTISKGKEDRLGRTGIAAYGGNEQFAGRFLHVIHLNYPSPKLYKKILHQVEMEVRQLFTVPRHLLSDGEADEIIRKAMDESAVGCRGLRSYIWDLVLERYTETILSETQGGHFALSDAQCDAILKAARSA